MNQNIVRNKTIKCHLLPQRISLDKYSLEGKSS